MISVAIMSHPSRRAYVDQLVQRLPDAVTVWDERNNVWDTGRRSLLAYDPDATHHLVIQDDAEVPSDLMQGCRQLLTHVPQGHPVSLYMGVARTRPRYRMDRIIDKRRSFAVFPGPWWGVGVIVPTADIPEIVAFGDTQDITNYDHRIARYYDTRDIPCYYTLPSLVNHRRGKSAMGRSGQNRRALWAAKRATIHDWSKGIVTPNGHKDFPPTP